MTVKFKRFALLTIRNLKETDVINMSIEESVEELKKAYKRSTKENSDYTHEVPMRLNIIKYLQKIGTNEAINVLKEIGSTDQGDWDGCNDYRTHFYRKNADVVRLSAIQAIAEISSDEAKETLRWFVQNGTCGESHWGWTWKKPINPTSCDKCLAIRKKAEMLFLDRVEYFWEGESIKDKTVAYYPDKEQGCYTLKPFDLKNGVAHIVERESIEESPSGNDSWAYIAFCGEDGPAWYFQGFPKTCHGTKQEVEKAGIPICQKCLQILGSN